MSILQRSDYSIAVDHATRSLIVRADTDVHREIRKILEELDQPPQLIAVDLTVTEVRVSGLFSLGFAFSVPLSAGDSSGEVIARLVSTPGGVGLAATPGPETTLFGRVDQQINVPFTIDDGTGIAIPITNSGVLTAGERKIRTDVLMRPSLIVTVGESHEIFVGTNVPVPVSSGSSLDEVSIGPDGSEILRSDTTIERRDTGVKLVIEARASKTGPIFLDLDVEISSLRPSLAGDVTEVGPTFIEQKFHVTAKLNDGEVAVIASHREMRKEKSRDGTPFFSSIPFLGWLFTSETEREEDLRIIVAAQVRRVSSPAALAADSIRRRLAFERRHARRSEFPDVDDDADFAVLVTTRSHSDDATAIAESLEFRGYAAQIHEWTLRDETYFDVYVTLLDSMSEAAEVASTLNREGWQADITVLPRKN